MTMRSTLFSQTIVSLPLLLPLLITSSGYYVPSNDNFSTPSILSGTTGTISTSNVQATSEQGEPNHASGTVLGAYSSIWFEYTAPSNGDIFFNTFGSTFDTTLGVYTGSAVDSLTAQANNDDTGVDYQSLVTFSATAGTTYYVAVDGYDASEQGDVILAWGIAPPNDDFVNATVISGTTGQISGSNILATAEPNEPNHGDGISLTAYVSVWYSFTPSQDSSFYFQTLGSSFDTTLAVYRGSSLDNLVKMAGNDDVGYEYSSLVTLSAQAETTYFIAVDGYDEMEQGNIVLSWGGPPDNDNFADALQLSEDSGTVSATNLAATAEPDEPNHGDGYGQTAYSSIWFSYKATKSGKITFNTYGSRIDTTLAAYKGTSINTLVKLVDNDDYGSDFSSQIIFSVQKDITYFVAVDGYDEQEQGDITLSYRYLFPWNVFIPAIQASTPNDT
ncbi:hypothetical protein [Desulfogranum japonicum]|uniref:hypothetical protein n=1 Tax=Desulfogranum japonicum TaxID=231447 RepID=UPI0003FAA86F|nr:hypothetical protein [Desulfogranum japonicum]